LKKVGKNIKAKINTTQLIKSIAQLFTSGGRGEVNFGEERATLYF
jgi:hypothetical protein